jgi:hypothetical protein
VSGRFFYILSSRLCLRSLAMSAQDTKQTSVALIAGSIAASIGTSCYARGPSPAARDRPRDQGPDEVSQVPTRSFRA